jgi:hypothetical protein
LYHSLFTIHYSLFTKLSTWHKAKPRAEMRSRSRRSAMRIRITEPRIRAIIRIAAEQKAREKQPF